MIVTEALKIALKKLSMDPRRLKSTLICYEPASSVKELNNIPKSFESIAMQTDNVLKQKGLSLEKVNQKLFPKKQKSGWAFIFETKELEKVIMIKVYEDTGEVTISPIF